MFRIKRTKAGAVAYATGIAKQGSVTGWAKEKESAVALADADAEKCLAFYAGLGLDNDRKAKLGKLEREPVSAEEIQAALQRQQEQADDAALAHRKMAEQVADLQQRVAVLEARSAVPASSPPPAGAGPEKKGEKK
jgi:hypothetical protein